MNYRLVPVVVFLVLVLQLIVIAPSRGDSPVPAVGISEHSVTVLIYHRFGEDKYPTTNVSAAQFRQQMVYLQEHNYTVLPVSELVRRLRDKEPLPAKAVVITMDDGYRSIYRVAWPVLQELRFPFTIFIYVKATDNGHWDYLDWSQLRELQAAGVDLQDHGYSHQRMAQPPAGMNRQQYRSLLREDLEKSRTILARELGEPPRYFAIPYGEYNKTVLEVGRSLGYEAILLQDPGSVSSYTDRFAIPREPILGNDWSTLEHFVSVLDRVDLPFTEPVPGAGLLKELQPPRIGAKLLDPARYLPGTLGVYVTELGWQQGRLDGDFLYIENKTRLQRRINRVAISGRELQSGRTAIRFWMVVSGQESEDRGD